MYLSTLSNIIFLSLLSTGLATINRTLTESSYRICGFNFHFSSQETKVILKSTGKFIPRNLLFTRFQSNGQNIYLTEPRYKSGVPATLSYVQLSRSGYDLSPIAYPNWASQEEGNCEAIQSAVDIFMDRNYNLWILDAGVTLNLENPNTKCPPKVVAVSTLTNSVTRTIDLSPLTTNSSNVQFLVAENYPGGDDYIYISDPGSKAIIVFNVGTGTGRRLVLPDSINCTDTSALYLALIRKGSNNNYLYFTYAACNNVYSISTATLSISGSSSSITLSGTTRDPIIFLGTDGQTQLYFRLRGQSDVYVWDTNTALPSEGWKKVWNGEKERVPTHVAPGSYFASWVLEANFAGFVNNTIGCLGDCSKLSAIYEI